MKFWQQRTHKGNVKGSRPAKDDTRTPLYMLFAVDSSGSMGESTHVINESGESMYIPKIDQANEGVRLAVKSMQRFMKENTRFQIKWLPFELNTYSKPIFSGYESVNDHSLAESVFKAEGSTNIEPLFNGFASFISRKYLGGYNRAVNIILISDGVPTDIDGWALSETEWKGKVDKFKAYLDENDFSRNVEFYFIAVGDEAEPFGRYFAGDDHFLKVEDTESIADKIDFATRLSLANSSTVPTEPIDFGDDEDDEEEDEELDEDDEEDFDTDEDDEEDFSDDTDEDFDDEDNDDDDEFDSDISDDSTDEDEEADDDTESDNDSDDDDDGDGDGDGEGGESLDDILNFKY